MEDLLGFECRVRVYVGKMVSWGGKGVYIVEDACGEFSPFGVNEKG